MIQFSNMFMTIVVFLTLIHYSNAETEDIFATLDKLEKDQAQIVVDSDLAWDKQVKLFKETLAASVIEFNGRVDDINQELQKLHNFGDQDIGSNGFLLQSGHVSRFRLNIQEICTKLFEVGHILIDSNVGPILDEYTSLIDPTSKEKTTYGDIISTQALHTEIQECSKSCLDYADKYQLDDQMLELYSAAIPIIKFTKIDDEENENTNTHTQTLSTSITNAINSIMDDKDFLSTLSTTIMKLSLEEKNAKETLDESQTSLDTATTLRDLQAKKYSIEIQELDNFVGSNTLIEAPTSEILIELETVFGTISEKIQAELAQLVSDATSNAKHKAWCDGELVEINEARDSKTTEVEKLTAQKKEIDERIETKKKQQGSLNSEISELADAMAEATKIRNEEKTEREQNKKKVKDTSTAFLTHTQNNLKMFSKVYCEKTNENVDQLKQWLTWQKHNWLYSPALFDDKNYEIKKTAEEERAPLQAQITTLETEITDQNGEIASLEEQIKRSTANREQEKAHYDSEHKKHAQIIERFQRSKTRLEMYNTVQPQARRLRSRKMPLKRMLSTGDLNLIDEVTYVYRDVYRLKKDLVVQYAQEQEEKDNCISQFNDNEAESKSAETGIEKLESQIAESEGELGRLAAEIAEAERKIQAITKIIELQKKRAELAQSSNMGKYNEIQSDIGEKKLLLESVTEHIADKNQQKASIEADIQGFNADLEDTNEEKGGLANQKADLHRQCDFRLKNYPIRAAAMRNEINALKDVEHYLDPKHEVVVEQKTAADVLRRRLQGLPEGPPEAHAWESTLSGLIQTFTDLIEQFTKKKDSLEADETESQNAFQALKTEIARQLETDSSTLQTKQESKAKKQQEKAEFDAKIATVNAGWEKLEKIVVRVQKINTELDNHIKSIENFNVIHCETDATYNDEQFSDIRFILGWSSNTGPKTELAKLANAESQDIQFLKDHQKQMELLLHDANKITKCKDTCGVHHPALDAGEKPPEEPPKCEKCDVTNEPELFGFFDEWISMTVSLLYPNGAPTTVNNDQLKDLYDSTWTYFKDDDERVMPLFSVMGYINYIYSLVEDVPDKTFDFSDVSTGVQKLKDWAVETIETVEDTAVAEYNQFKLDSSNDKTTKETNLQNNAKTLATASSDLAAKEEELAGAQGELEDANAAHKTLEPQCLKTLNYESIKAREDDVINLLNRVKPLIGTKGIDGIMVELGEADSKEWGRQLAFGGTLGLSDIKWADGYLEGLKKYIELTKKAAEEEEKALISSYNAFKASKEQEIKATTATANEKKETLTAEIDKLRDWVAGSQASIRTTCGQIDEIHKYQQKELEETTGKVQWAELLHPVSLIAQILKIERLLSLSGLQDACELPDIWTYDSLSDAAATFETECKAVFVELKETLQTKEIQITYDTIVPVSISTTSAISGLISTVKTGVIDKIDALVVSVDGFGPENNV